MNLSQLVGVMSLFQLVGVLPIIYRGRSLNFGQPTRLLEKKEKKYQLFASILLHNINLITFLNFTSKLN